MLAEDGAQGVGYPMLLTRPFRILRLVPLRTFHLMDTARAWGSGGGSAEDLRRQPDGRKQVEKVL